MPKLAIPMLHVSSSRAAQVPLTVTGDRMTLGTPTMDVEFAFADFLGRSDKLGYDDRLLVKLLPSTARSQRFAS